MPESALLCTSHSPLMHYVQPPKEVRAAVDVAFADARAFVSTFAPELVVVFAPDHYNGFFYDMMPPFAIGAACTSIGDYDSPSGPLTVDRDAAYILARGALAGDLDVTISEQMYVDHGFAQPLQLLFGGLDVVPVVPVFINSVAEPLGPPRRARLLGDALGRAAMTLDRRVLFLGSGGLSHDPPAPRLADASPDVAARLVSEGRNLTPAQRAEREQRTLRAAENFAVGLGTIQPLNPDWDHLIMDILAHQRWDAVDAWTTEWFTEQAGHSSHEVRTWIAAHAALAVTGAYEVTSTFYAAIPEWIAGFGMTSALPKAQAAEFAARPGWTQQVVTDVS